MIRWVNCSENWQLGGEAATHEERLLWFFSMRVTTIRQKISPVADKWTNRHELLLYAFNRKFILGGVETTTQTVHGCTTY